MRSLFIIVLFTFTQANAKWVSLEQNQKQAPEKSVVKTETGYLINVKTTGFDYQPVKVKGINFSRLNLYKSNSALQEVGKPQIPVIRQLVELPTGAAILKITSAEKKRIHLPLAGIADRIAPAQESSAKLPNAAEIPLKLDPKIYNFDSVYPQFEARIAYQGSVRGHQIAMIEIAPVQYNATRGDIVYAPDMKVEVINQAPTSELPKKFNSKSFDAYQTDIIEGYKPTSDVASAEGLLVIVGEGFEKSANVTALVESKKSRGYAVTTRNVADLGNDPQSIRAAIQKLYKEAPSSSPLVYVLLVGDVDKIASYDQGEFTNNYYAAIDKGTYAEDSTFPDLAVGRLTVSTEAELAVVVNKIVKYDIRKFNDSSWRNKISFIATDDLYEVAEGTHNYVINNYTGNLGYKGIFPTADEKGGDKLYAITNNATSADVINSANNGRVLISYSGHGAEDGWLGPQFGMDDVKSLTHDEALPYVMSHACLTGSFGNSSDSFAEVWLKTEHGAIGYWGTSNLSYWDEDDILEKAFFDGVYKEGIKTVGQMNLFGLQGVRTFYNNEGRTEYYYQIYNLMGDPTTELMLP